jgi:phosphatidylglycerophosphate synthase
VQRPLNRLLHDTLGVMPTHISWAAFGASAVAAGLIGTHHVGWGLITMAFGQVLDGMDGAMARQYNLVSDAGRRLDDMLDRASETVIFLAFWWGGFVALNEVFLALCAVILLTTISNRSRLDPGAKRFALYFGLLFPWMTIFRVIAGVNLAGYVIGLLIIDCKFQVKMDKIGGDLDTVASRAIKLEMEGKL